MALSRPRTTRRVLRGSASARSSSAVSTAPAAYAIEDPAGGAGQPAEQDGAPGIQAAHRLPLLHGDGRRTDDGEARRAGLAAHQQHGFAPWSQQLPSMTPDTGQRGTAGSASSANSAAFWPSESLLR